MELSKEDFCDFIRAMCLHLEQFVFYEYYYELARMINSAWTSSSYFLEKLDWSARGFLRGMEVVCLNF